MAGVGKARIIKTLSLTTVKAMAPENSKGNKPAEEQPSAASPAQETAAEPTPDDQQAGTDEASAGEPPRAARPRAGTTVVAVMALLLAVLALAAGGYLGYVYYEKQRPFNAELRTALKDIRSDTTQIEEKRAALQAALQKELDVFKGQLDHASDVQDTLRRAVDKVISDLGRNRNDWVLAEAEQLLLMANYRLQLARDTQTAVVALRAADRRLEQLADPALLPIRKLIADEITEVQSLGRADVPGIALQLGSLANAVGKFPLDTDRTFRPLSTAAVSQATEGEGSGWRFLREMWQDLIGLVRIRVSANVQKPLLSPEQSYFLQENLRLMLYGAQLAALHGDSAIYRQNIDAAQAWLKDYFDADAQPVSNTQQELERLVHEKIVIEPPDISGSLDALRTFMKKKESG
jgi:uroporphyrin-3 C-methyltransferase